ncbi:hypothetical protein P8452_25422 [Trifolium repens]|nr:hypothetical protein P8452_25422 [Trifolium repens]
MALLRAKKEINKFKNMHRNIPHISIIEALPKDLLVEIVGKVASRSMADLCKTALEGHHEAKYVYSMLLMANCEHEEGRKLGFDLFAELKNSMGLSVARCRKRVKCFIQSMWVRNHVVVPNQGFPLCCSITCQRNRIEKMKKHSTWHADDEIDNDGGCISCKYCDGNCELDLFCNIFRV